MPDSRFVKLLYSWHRGRAERSFSDCSRCVKVAELKMLESVLSLGLEVLEMTYEELTELTRLGGRESMRLSLSGYVVWERKLVLMSFSSRMLSVMLVIIGSMLSRPDIGRPGRGKRR